MANDYFALADLQTINDSNLSGLEVNDLFIDAPLLQVMPAVMASNGDRHKYLKWTGGPNVGFRSVNDGREHDSSDYSAVTVDLKILDASFTVDQALANTFNGGPEALIAQEGLNHLRQSFFKVEQQLVNGTAEGDAAGFDGLADQHASSGTYTLLQGGTTNLTSVYLVRAGQSATAVITGMDGQIEVGESLVQRIAGSATGWLPAYFTSVTAWYGLQQGATPDHVRLANVDAGSNTVDDAMIYTGLEVFPANRQPTHIVMNRRSLEQLRASRTATNTTGAPAPRPTEVEGIPIVVTDALGNAETAVV